MIKETAKVLVKSVSPGFWYGLSRTRQRLRAERKVGFVQDPILVYQMAKVGSTAVKQALQAAGAEGVYQIHFLAGDLSARIRARHKRGLIPNHRLYTGQALNRRIRRPDFRCKIISLVRDPIARCISGLFENHRAGFEGIAGASGCVDVERAVRHLHRRLEGPDACKYAFEWFDRELKSVFGIDVFAHPFDKKAGYAHIEDGNTEVLVLRLENLSELLPTVLSDFTGHELEIVRARQSKGSREADAYRRVKQSVAVSPEACRRIYGAPFVQHFYSKPMILKFIRRWSR